MIATGVGVGVSFGGSLIDPAIALINDGNTKVFADYLTTSSITLRTGAFVSKWADSLLSGNDLENRRGSGEPTLGADGITFSCTSACGMRTPAIASLAQPITVYFVAKQLAYTSGRYLFDGRLADSGELAQSGTNPNLIIYAGAILNNNTATINDFQIYTVVFNGANSIIQVNQLTAATGNAGTGNMGGLTIGAAGANDFVSFASLSNITVKGAIQRTGADTAGNRTIIQNYLKTYYGI